MESDSKPPSVVPEPDPATEGTDIFQVYSNTCSAMFSKISKSQIAYLQAAVKLQEGALNGCNSLVKNQLDMLQKYWDAGIMNKDQVKPAVQAANNFMQSYSDWITFSYDIAVARMKFYHDMVGLFSEYFPNMQSLLLKWGNLFKENPLWRAR